MQRNEKKNEMDIGTEYIIRVYNQKKVISVKKSTPSIFFFEACERTLALSSPDDNISE